MRTWVLSLSLVLLGGCARGLPGLPLVEYPATGGADTLVVLLSGDGGWARIDKALARRFAQRGCPVVGLDSLRYFWKPRTPEGTAADLARILDHYQAAWHARKVVLVGFSFGADVLPFAVNRLPPRLASQVSLVALLSPTRTTSFEFHLSQWLGGPAKGPEEPLLPELRRLRSAQALCVYGTQEPDTPCRGLEPGVAQVIALEGDHHLGGNYDALADLVLQQAGIR